MIADQGFPHRLDDRNPASHCRFKVERHILLLGQGDQLITVPSQQRLVAGHHGFPGKDGGLDQIIGLGDPSDQFHDHGNFGVVHEVPPVSGQHPFRDLHVRIFLEGTHRNPLHLDPHSRTVSQEVAIPDQVLIHAGPHIAESGQAYENCLRFTAHGHL